MARLTYLPVLVLFIVKIAIGDFERNEDLQGAVTLHLDPATWKEARGNCHEEGGILASPETEERLSTMLDVMRASAVKRVYIGVHDMYSTGHFQSLQGTPLAQIPAKLLSEQSSKDGADSCLVIDHDGILAKSKCSDRLPYVCYKSDPSCGSKYNGYKYHRQTGSCYKVHDDKLSWTSAFAVCAAEDAHLAIINSHTEAEVLVTLLKPKKILYPGGAAHMGFLDWGNDTFLWMTVHGQTLEQAGYQKWAPGEPNGVQRCGAMYLHGGLDNIHCKGQEMVFVCEKPPERTMKRTRIIEQLKRCPKDREPFCFVC